SKRSWGSTPTASPGVILKKGASKDSSPSKNPPHFEFVFPGWSASGLYQVSGSQRSFGTSCTASVPLSRRLQNASGLSAPPGKRQAIPTMAMGSAIETFRDLGFALAPAPLASATCSTLSNRYFAISNDVG